MLRLAGTNEVVDLVELDKLNFNKDGLVPTIVQDVKTGEVLMMAYMNREALTRTVTSGRSWFWSRSRRELWQKGETSGNFQEVEEIYYDCDQDTILLKVTPVGPACHTGHRSCFYRRLTNEGAEAREQQWEPQSIFAELYEVIRQRGRDKPTGSYTTSLWNEGLDTILGKVSEEAGEVVEAAQIKDRDEVIYEVADLTFHLLVLLAFKDISLEEIGDELRRRRRP